MDHQTKITMETYKHDEVISKSQKDYDFKPAVEVRTIKMLDVVSIKEQEKEECESNLQPISTLQIDSDDELLNVDSSKDEKMIYIVDSTDDTNENLVSHSVIHTENSPKMNPTNMNNIFDTHLNITNHLTEKSNYSLDTLPQANEMTQCESSITSSRMLPFVEAVDNIEDGVDAKSHSFILKADSADGEICHSTGNDMNLPETGNINNTTTLVLSECNEKSNLIGQLNEYISLSKTSISNMECDEMCSESVQHDMIIETKVDETMNYTTPDISSSDLYKPTNDVMNLELCETSTISSKADNAWARPETHSQSEVVIEPSEKFDFEKYRLECETFPIEMASTRMLEIRKSGNQYFNIEESQNQPQLNHIYTCENQENGTCEKLLHDDEQASMSAHIKNDSKSTPKTISFNKKVMVKKFNYGDSIVDKVPSKNLSKSRKQSTCISPADSTASITRKPKRISDLCLDMDIESAFAQIQEKKGKQNKKRNWKMKSNPVLNHIKNVQIEKSANTEYDDSLNGKSIIPSRSDMLDPELSQQNLLTHNLLDATNCYVRVPQMKLIDKNETVESEEITYLDPELLKEVHKCNYTDEEIRLLLESLKSGIETKLPFKKRRMALPGNELVNEISYPATPMLSIAEIEALQPKVCETLEAMPLRIPSTSAPCLVQLSTVEKDCLDLRNYQLLKFLPQCSYSNSSQFGIEYGITLRSSDTNK